MIDILLPFPYSVTEIYFSKSGFGISVTYLLEVEVKVKL